MLLFPFRKIHPYRPSISNCHKFIMGNQMRRQGGKPSLGCIYRDIVWKPKQKFLLWEQGIQTYCIKLAGYLRFTNSICMRLQKMPPAWKASLMTEKVYALRVCLFNKQYVWSQHLNGRGRKIRASRTRAYLFLLYHYKPVVYRGLSFPSYQI